MPGRKSVLIVEDDRVVKNSLTRLLEGGDCEIDSAVSGEEGLTRFQEKAYDLVLTDLKLPDMDGMDMVQRMRQKVADLPFIVLTAFGDKKDAQRALEMGAVTFFQKPFDAQQVLQMTQTAFDPHSHRGSEFGTPINASPASATQNEGESEIEQLIRLNMLLAPFASIGRQTSGITHNLNGFLTGLMGHLELLRMKRSDLAKELDGIIDLAKRIRDNVADLSSKYENEIQEEPQPQNINQILRHELTFLHADLFFKHYVSVKLDLQEPLPAVWAQYVDLSQTLEEIIVNAVDVQRDRKSGEIRIKTYSEKDRVYVEVEDNGPGFSPQALEHATQLLWPQIRVSEEGAVRTGMGLYIARRRLEAWRGIIKIENSATQGGKVTITLPEHKKPSS